MIILFIPFPSRNNIQIWNMFLFYDYTILFCVQIKVTHRKFRIPLCPVLEPLMSVVRNVHTLSTKTFNCNCFSCHVSTESIHDRFFTSFYLKPIILSDDYTVVFSDQLEFNCSFKGDYPNIVYSLCNLPDDYTYIFLVENFW